MKPFRLIVLVLIIIVAAVAASAVLAVTIYPGLLNLQSTAGLQCPSGPATSSGQTPFTIVMSNQGFNGSRTSVSCPTLNVSKGQSITLHVVNNDGETHRFAITHYLAGGIDVHPGQSTDATFVADQAGSFVIYCSVHCTAHLYMQNGRLNVA